MRDSGDYSLSERLSRESDKIVSLILYSDYPWIDIQIQIERLRELVETEMPERMELFEQLYASRFQRIREQWRNDENLM